MAENRYRRRAPLEEGRDGLVEVHGAATILARNEAAQRKGLTIFTPSMTCPCCMSSVKRTRHPLWLAQRSTKSIPEGEAVKPVNVDGGEDVANNFF